MVGALQKKWLMVCEVQKGRLMVRGMRRRLSSAPLNQELPTINQPADPAAHEHRVEQRAAHSHIAVIGHEAQQEELGPHKAHGEKVLGSAAREGDGAPARKVVSQGLWHDGGDVQHVDEREVAEQEVHGHVQEHVSEAQEDQEPIGNHGRQ